MEKIKKILYLLLVFGVGYLISYLNKPEPTVITKTVVDIQYKEKIVYREAKNIHTKKKETIKPDGTIIKEEESLDLSKIGIDTDKSLVQHIEQTQTTSPRKRFYGGAITNFNDKHGLQGAVHLGKDILLNGQGTYQQGQGFSGMAGFLIGF